MADLATPPPLPLDAVPDDLLRRVFRHPSLSLHDILRFSMCSKGCRRAVHERDMLPALKVSINSTGPLVTSSGLVHGGPLDLRRGLSPTGRVQVAANVSSLDWLTSWPLLRGARGSLEYANVIISSVGDAAAEPLLPESWRALRDALDATGTRAHYTLNVPQKDLRDLMAWVEGSTCLGSLSCYLPSAYDNATLAGDCGALGRLTRLRRLSIHFEDVDFEGASFDDSLSGLASLTGLQELKLDVFPPDTLAPVWDSLTALTSLTFTSYRWGEPFGLLPRNLKYFCLMARYFPGPFVQRTGEARHICEPLSCPGLRASVGAAAAASLRHLHVIINMENFRECRDYTSQNCLVDLFLTPDSIPCAFPGLEQLTVILEDATDHPNVPHTADLVALLEAAPGLRGVWLRGFYSLSFNTMLCLQARRPGFKMRGGPSWGNCDIVLELPSELEPKEIKAE
jgi:hypothetical protein